MILLWTFVLVINKYVLKNKSIEEYTMPCYLIGFLCDFVPMLKLMLELNWGSI
jgi:hypothetical protein